jgi:leader peptidase (prepilin peptidase) / N-methyltransferase
MNALLAATGSALAAVALWTIAADAAARRRVTIGTLPIVLPVVAAAAAAIAAVAGAHAAAAAGCAGVAVAAWIDARSGSIFDPLTATVMLASLMLCAVDGTVPGGIFGAASAGGVLLLLHALTNGRGFGLGDVKLGATIGMALGASAGLTAIGLAFIFGGAYGVWLIATKRATAQTAIRFGPFIAAGTFTALALPLVLRP